MIPKIKVTRAGGYDPRLGPKHPANQDSTLEQTSAMHCDHANEVPMSCPCTPTCYCKSHTCRTVQAHAVQLEEYGGGKSKLWHRWLCSCGSAGEWKDKQSQAKIGGTKHVATVGKKRCVTE